MSRLPSSPAHFSIGGFTLLEMLVVMAISSLVAGLLFQALAQVTQLQQRFGVEIFRAQQGAMQIDWYRNTLDGLVPDQDDGANRFSGAPDRLSGLTLAPLDARGGALHPFAWQLHYDNSRDITRLLYGTGSKEISIIEWPGRSGRFRYGDVLGNSHEQWPPPLDKTPQLPRFIVLQFEEEGGRSRHIVVTPKSADKPLPNLKEILKL